MKIRSKFLALLGAGVLTMGVVGVAFAETLKEAHQGITVGWDDQGDPFTDGFDGGPNSEECEGEQLGVGEILFHFVQSGEGTAAGADDTNLLDAYFTGADDQLGVVDDTVQGNGKNVDWFVLTGSLTGADVTLDTAESNVEGGELRVSHICVGDEPNFEQSEEAFTDPPTDTFAGDRTSGPADGAWLLVVALGVLLASIVVLTPARAKTRR